jgi:hypothetical protein
MISRSKVKAMVEKNNGSFLWRLHDPGKKKTMAPSFGDFITWGRKKQWLLPLETSLSGEEKNNGSILLRTP